MGAFFEYLLKANIVLSVLVTVYYVSFRKEKFLQINRIVLLFIFLAILILPLCPQVFKFNIFSQHTQQLSSQSGVTVKDGTKQISSVDIESELLYKLGTLSYLFIIVALSGRVIIQTWRIMRVINNSDKYKRNRIVYCRPTENIPPCSFFNYIIINQAELKPETYNQILTHEQAHCSQAHSIDVILSELLCILLWMNPLAVVYRKQVQLNLEFLADEQVINSGADRRSYQLSLLQHVLGDVALNVANSFYSSKVKQRVSMMNAVTASRNKYKYLLLLPLLLSLYLFIAPQNAVSTPLPATMSRKNVESPHVLQESSEANREKIISSAQELNTKRTKPNIMVRTDKRQDFPVESISPDTPFNILAKVELPSITSTENKPTATQTNEIEGKPLLRVQGYPLPAKSDVPLSATPPPTEVKGKSSENRDRLEPIVVQGYQIKPPITPER